MWLVIFFVALLSIAAIIVAAVCGSGKCGGSPSPPPSPDPCPCAPGADPVAQVECGECCARHPGCGRCIAYCVLRSPPPAPEPPPPHLPPPPPPCENASDAFTYSYMEASFERDLKQYLSRAGFLPGACNSCEDGYHAVWVSVLDLCLPTSLPPSPPPSPPLLVYQPPEGRPAGWPDVSRFCAAIPLLDPYDDAGTNAPFKVCVPSTLGRQASDLLADPFVQDLVVGNDALLDCPTAGKEGLPYCTKPYLPRCQNFLQKGGGGGSYKDRLVLEDQPFWTKMKQSQYYNITAGTGCIDGLSVLKWLKDLLFDKLNDLDLKPGSNASVSSIVGNVIERIFDYLQSSQGPSFFNSFKVCFGSLTGAEIKDPDSSVADIGCNLLQLNDDETFGVAGVRLPLTEPMIASMCPTLDTFFFKGDVRPPGTMQFCLAYAGCWVNEDWALPTLAVSIDQNFLKCVLNSVLAESATLGLSALASYGLIGGKKMDPESTGVSFGVSPTGDLATTVELFYAPKDYDTDDQVPGFRMVRAAIRGNLGMAISLGGSPFAPLCGDGDGETRSICSVLTFEGNLELMLGVYQSNAVTDGSGSSCASTTRCGTSRENASKVCGAPCDTRKQPQPQCKTDETCYDRLDETPSITDDNGIVAYTPENIWGLTFAISFKSSLSIDLKEACTEPDSKSCKWLPQFSIELQKINGAFSGVGFRATDLDDPNGTPMEMDPGLYLFYNAFSLKEILASILGPIVDYFGGILDGLFGGGTAGDIKEWLKVKAPTLLAIGLKVTSTASCTRVYFKFQIWKYSLGFGFETDGCSKGASQPNRPLAITAPAAYDSAPSMWFECDILSFLVDQIKAALEWVGEAALWVLRKGGEIVAAFGADLLDAAKTFAKDVYEATSIAMKWLADQSGVGEIGSWAQKFVLNSLGDLTEEAAQMAKEKAKEMLKAADHKVDEMEEWFEETVWGTLKELWKWNDHNRCTFTNREDLYKGHPRKPDIYKLAKCCMEACHASLPFGLFDCAASADKWCIEECLCAASMKGSSNIPKTFYPLCTFGRISCGAEAKYKGTCTCGCDHYLSSDWHVIRDSCSADYTPSRSSGCWPPGECKCDCQ